MTDHSRQNATAQPIGARHFPLRRNSQFRRRGLYSLTPALVQTGGLHRGLHPGNLAWSPGWTRVFMPDPGSAVYHLMGIAYTAPEKITWLLSAICSSSGFHGDIDFNRSRDVDPSPPRFLCLEPAQVFANRQELSSTPVPVPVLQTLILSCAAFPAWLCG